MNKKVELYCTYDTDSEVWFVWFPHPLGGMEVLGEFDSETEARSFWQEQIDSADWDN
jgi:hypothetical protein